MTIFHELTRLRFSISSWALNSALETFLADSVCWLDWTDFSGVLFFDVQSHLSLMLSNEPTTWSEFRDTSYITFHTTEHSSWKLFFYFQNNHFSQNCLNFRSVCKQSLTGNTNFPKNAYTLHIYSQDSINAYNNLLVKFQNLDLILFDSFLRLKIKSKFF